MRREPIVRMTPDEIEDGKAEGTLRYQRALAAGIHVAGIGSEWNDQRGAIAELAVAKFFGFPRETVFLDQQAAKGADIPHMIDVKAGGRPTDGMLLIPDAWPQLRYVFTITHDFRAFVIRGWMDGHEALTPGYWRADLPRPCYRIPPGRLHDISELVQIIEKEKRLCGTTSSIPAESASRQQQPSVVRPRPPV